MPVGQPPSANCRSANCRSANCRRPTAVGQLPSANCRSCRHCSDGGRPRRREPIKTLRLRRRRRCGGRAGDSVMLGCTRPPS
jgi:hypothetical protein